MHPSLADTGASSFLYGNRGELDASPKSARCRTLRGERLLNGKEEGGGGLGRGVFNTAWVLEGKIISMLHSMLSNLIF